MNRNIILAAYSKLGQGVNDRLFFRAVGLAKGLIKDTELDPVATIVSLYKGMI